MKRSIKTLITAFTIGAISVGAAWAGVGLTPAHHSLPAAHVGPVAQARSAVKHAAAHTSAVGATTSAASATTAQSGAFSAADLAPGQVLAGAAKVSIEPRPQDYNGTWVKEGCATLGDDSSHILDNFSDFRVKWPENPNCLYMGGFGIGPMNPITKWTDPYGLWARSVAISDGSDTIVLTILDGTYYFGKYASMCTGCGFFDLSQTLGAQLGLKPESFFFASTHSHSAPDFIGGWGGVPDWYMRQVTDALKLSVTQAVQNEVPAVLEDGEQFARQFNSQRRDFYRSAEDNAMSWVRALAVTDDVPCIGPLAARCPTIATVGAFAAHPTFSSDGVATADYPGVFEKDVEDRFGGVGLYFETGLGNISRTSGSESMGNGLAALLPGKGWGTPIANPDVIVKQVFFDQPVTNSGLTGLGLPGFFDRPFEQRPSSVSAGPNGTKPCRSASPVTVNTAVSAARIGSLLITGGPGELFSNVTNTIEEQNPNGITMALSLVNDGLGYIMQSFETDHVGRQVVGFVGQVAEYEDAYSIDACFGDQVLEQTLALTSQLH
ncbi:MAG: hypothetical protein ABR600_01250 [Actinomycetota bacterium]